jgi:hypothetical protein
MIYVVPSRGRPHHVRELIDQWDQVTEDAYLHIALDSDDPQLAKTLENLPVVRPFFLQVSITDPAPLITKLNDFAVQYAHDHDFVGYMSDLHRPHSIAWDSSLKYLLQSRGVPGLMTTDPGMSNVLMSSEIIQSIGCMVPPVIERFGASRIWKMWAQHIGFAACAVGVNIGVVPRPSGRVQLRLRKRDTEAIDTYELDRFHKDMRIIQGVIDAPRSV